VTTFGRSATDLLLQTRHLARGSRDRRHPANLDPFATFVTDGFRGANRGE
jgi:hypothetical protein